MLAVTLVVYAGTLSTASSVWDDNLTIYREPRPRRPRAWTASPGPSPTSPPRCGSSRSRSSA
ncbi:MAG: hypothetical protein MZV70_54120 [Desulfobacterales bacterium]|nr:hypothetical protein [Desulfobacterales bacterium]